MSNPEKVRGILESLYRLDIDANDRPMREYERIRTFGGKSSEDIVEALDIYNDKGGRWKDFLISFLWGDDSL